MKLLHLKAHNVFSIGDIEMNLKDRGLTLVTGWSYDDNNGNAAGKSSLARNAITWGMYGKTVDGVKADAVINTSIKNAKHCGVTLKFEGVDGNTYRIYRARKPNCLVLSILNPGALEDEEEWQDLSQRLDKDTQQIVDALLGRDHRTFIQANFFGQGREQSFLALPGSEQRAVIEEILPLSSLESWHVNAGEAKKKAQEKVDNARTSLRAQRERSTMASDHYEGLKSQKNTWDTDMIVELSGLQHKINKIQLTSSGVEEEIKSLMQALPVQPLEESFEMYREEERLLQSENNKLGYKIDTLTGDIDARAARPDVCSSCNQRLPVAAVEANNLSLVSDKATREVLVKKRDSNIARMYNNDAQLAICKEVEQLKVTLNMSLHEATLKEKRRLLEEATNPFTRVTITAAANREKERTAYDTYNAVLLAEESMRDHYQFWDKAFGRDLKTLLFDQVCPYLEAKANKYLADLNNGQIKVSFSVTKEMKSGDTKDQFSVTASSSTGSKAFELFSGAEKQLTSFAVGMALSDLAGLQTKGATKFMILDEPFLYQSPQNCEAIVSFLTTQKAVGDSTILLISNEDNLAGLIPNRVHVVKRNGVSSLE